MGVGCGTKGQGEARGSQRQGLTLFLGMERCPMQRGGSGPFSMVLKNHLRLSP